MDRRDFRHPGIQDQDSVVPGRGDALSGMSGIGDIQAPEDYNYQNYAECPPRESEIISRAQPQICFPPNLKWLYVYVEYLKNQFLDKFAGIMTNIPQNVKQPSDVVPPFFTNPIDDTQCDNVAAGATSTILTQDIPARHRAVVAGIGWAHDAVTGFQNVTMDLLANGQQVFPYANMMIQRGTPTNLRPVIFNIDGPVTLGFRASNAAAAPQAYEVTASWRGWFFALQKDDEFSGSRFQP